MGKVRSLAGVRVMIVVTALLAPAPVQAYYHYVHYLTPGAPYAPVFEKFDLSALPNKTVMFLVTDSGPAHFAQNDDFASVLGQVRQAAAVWNSVASSDLRVAFGGVEAANQVANTPGGAVIFVDLPPGLLGMGAPTSSTTQISGPDGSFFPVVRSTVMLSNDTTRGAGPSYLEGFFTTAVHEMGHALGLQHTFTGAAMSQAVIRNTSRMRPIDQDDIAGLSLLYGTAGYAATVGSISGHVRLSNGQPVALASVVAITSTGPAVSTLTNPDGTFRIDGLAPKQYWVYVHPAPPDAFQNFGIKGPFDSGGQPIAATAPFETLFYPGTRDPNQFGLVPVAAGAGVSGIDFSVQPRASVPMYDLVTYSYSGSLSVSPAFFNSNRAVATIAAQALSPLTTPMPQSVAAPGLIVAGVRSYGSPVALALDLVSLPFAGIGPRHLLFNLGNDMYVLPDGLVLVQHDPPAISSVTPNSDGTVTVAGTNFDLSSRVYFDGLPATASSPFSGDTRQATITVTPPPGYGGQNASVIVYNSDGQNSTFYQAQNPPLYTYPTAGTPQISVTPSALPAGVSAMVDVTGSNIQLVDGHVTVGFGTFDVLVGRVWVLSPTHVIANVAVAPGAALGASEISVISGFQRAVQPSAFQTKVSDPSQPVIAAVVNADGNQQTLYVGAFATVFGGHLQVSGTNPQVTLNDQAARIVYAAANQINFVVPGGLPTGPAILKVSNAAGGALPYAIQIDSPPPVIVGFTNAKGQALDISKPVASGDIIQVIVSSPDPSLAGSQGRIHVTLSGVDTPLLQVIAGPAQGTVQVMFQVTQSSGGIGVPLVVTVDAGHSDPFTITVN